MDYIYNLGRGQGISCASIYEPRSGDFDSDGALTEADIDALAEAIVGQSIDPQFDLNSDSNATLEDYLMWVKDLKHTWLGAANLDGEFTSSDLTAVFQATKYETDEDAGWAEGDWNGDLRFTVGKAVKLE